MDPRALEAKIDYLIEASERLGRVDWRGIFIATLFTWTLTGLVPPEGLRAALAFAAQTLGHLFGGLPQLPMT